MGGNGRRALTSREAPKYPRDATFGERVVFLASHLFFIHEMGCFVQFWPADVHMWTEMRRHNLFDKNVFSVYIMMPCTSGASMRD